VINDREREGALAKVGDGVDGDRGRERNVGIWAEGDNNQSTWVVTGASKDVTTGRSAEGLH
jgi:hypothetical protein